MCFNDSLSQGSAQYSQPASSSPLPGFVNKLLLEQNPHSTVYMLSMAAFVLQQQNLVITTETIWPAKPNRFTLWPFIVKVG